MATRPRLEKTSFCRAKTGRQVSAEVRSRRSLCAPILQLASPNQQTRIETWDAKIADKPPIVQYADVEAGGVGTLLREIVSMVSLRIAPP